ncbi:hypothetical protein Syun_010898 [Stephania yunnanensis]|uniref:Uncharacterized protein n=1 Tax=Stephania yunnanensis TaxID=152371 RepID=A0AAP0JXV0_9MAGN
MLKKKMKGFSGVGVGVRVSPSPTPPSSYAFDEEARVRFKHHSLIQDFDELYKETQARKMKLQMLDRRKATLSAEVRFLRRRYNYLMKIRSLETQPALPDQSRPQVSDGHREAPAPSKPRPCPNLDLNQISNGEDDEEFQFVPDPPKPDKFPSKKFFMNGNNEQEQIQLQQQQHQQSDMKLSICRGVPPNGANRSGKRKITWQDQVALRV